VAAARTRPSAVDDRPLFDRTVERTLAKRYEATAREIGGVLEATYRVIERTGTVDPRMQDILSEAGLSTQGFYRLFTSKDELMLLLLDDGRRRLADYLRHRMAKESTASGQVSAWIAGTLAQVQNQRAATRTRPFVVHLSRLYEQYPAEQHESMAVLLSLLEQAIQHGVDVGELTSDDAARAAESVYFLTYGLVEHHLRAGSVPTPDEVDYVVSFALRGLGAG
jgi:AcrR family transcriptional regulator